MGAVNIQITHNGYSLSGYLLGHERTNELCSGIGTLSVAVDTTVPRTFENGDTMVLYEEGVKKGTFYISTIANTPDGKTVLSCQDGSKWLEAYFIFKSYPTNGLTTRYWISFILDLAKIDYNFTTSETGYALNPNTAIGIEGAYEAVVRLCQQSGWYFYFDANGICNIGSLDSGWGSPAVSLVTSEGRVLTEFMDSSDDNLRNRVVVYGSDGVNAELVARTPWDRDSNDYRTVVYTNGYIDDLSVAYTLGKTILDEYSRTLSVKVYTVAGHVNATVGSTVRCRTNVFRGVGRITKILSHATSEGFVTELTVDETCPRLLGYWRLGDDEHVYVGSKSDGVYRKPISGTTWESYNTGITNLNIRDLKIKNGLLVCTTDSYQAYMRDVSDTSWTQITPIGFTTYSGESLVDVYTSGFIAKGCGIEDTGIIHVGYYNPNTNISWVMTTVPSDLSPQTWTRVIVASGNAELIDIDTDNVNIVGTAITRSNVSPTSQAWEEGGSLLQGEQGDLYTKTPLPFDLVSTGTSYTSFDAETAFTQIGGPTYIKDNKLWYCRRFNSLVPVPGNLIYCIDLATNIRTSYVMDTTEWHSPFNPSIMYVENDTTIHFIGYQGTTSTTRHVVAHLDTLTYTVEDDDLPYVYVVQNENFVAGTFVTGEGSYGSGTNYSSTVSMVVYNFLTQTHQLVTTPNLIPADYRDSSIWYMELEAFAAPFGTGTTTKGGIHFGGFEGNRAYKWLSQNEDDIFGSLVLLSYDINTGTFSTSSLVSYLEIGPPISGFWTGATNDGAIINTVLGSVKETGESYIVVGGASRFSNDSSLTFRRVAIIKFPQGEIIRYYNYKYDFSLNSLYASYHDYAPYPLTKRSDPPVCISKRRADILSGTSEWNIENIATGEYWGSSWLPFSTEPYYDLNFSQSIDEYDNTLLVYNGDFTHRALDITTGEEKKVYNNLSTIREQYTILKDHILSGLSAYSTFDAILYNISGTAFPPGGRGVSAISNGFVTTAGDTFGILGTFATSGNVYVEVPAQAPTIFFGGTLPSGEMKLNYSSNFGNSLTKVYNQAYSAIPLSITNLGNYGDARSATVLGLTYTPYGKSYSENPTSYDHYLFTVASSGNVGGVYYKPSSTPQSNWALFQAFSGVVSKLELSNFGLVTPYVFTSISGNPSHFWQLNPNEETFVEYSAGLPNSNITVIRLDDRI